MAGKIELMIDVVSPFAYLAFHVLKHSPVFANVEIIYTPVLLGGILKAVGSAPPISITNKRIYLLKDRMRWSRLFDLPMIETMPPNFPWNTTLVQRALLAAMDSRPDSVPDLIERLYRTGWVEGKDIASVDVYLPVFVQVFGEEAANKILESARSDELKQALIKNGQRAMNSGCFGLPWFIVTNAKGEEDTFWGFDHLGQILDFLGLDRGHSTSDTKRGWKAML